MECAMLDMGDVRVAAVAVSRAGLMCGDIIGACLSNSGVAGHVTMMDRLASVLPSPVAWW